MSTPELFDIEPATSRTEADMIALLRKRYNRDGGNGPRYVGASHVRSNAGFDARRIADFIAMDLWPSKGLALHGHEVKVSRSDWLSELKTPEKAGAFTPYMDYWWLVTAVPGIALTSELPAGWGLMVAGDSALKVMRPAKRNSARPMPKTMMAAFLRAAVKTAVGCETPPEGGAA
jgi:hypothetical protein